MSIIKGQSLALTAGNKHTHTQRDMPDEINEKALLKINEFFNKMGKKKTPTNLAV